LQRKKQQRYSNLKLKIKTAQTFGGISSAAFTISSSSFLKSSSPVEGMMMVSRRPPTS
jgi:hypothetical protein